MYNPCQRIPPNHHTLSPNSYTPPDRWVKELVGGAVGGAETEALHAAVYG
jgi:hypothetical protein